MNKFLLSIIPIVVTALLLSACGDNNQSIAEFQEYQNYETLGKESQDAYRDEILVMETRRFFPIYKSVDILASIATDIIRVEIIDERVEQINTWLPSENEHQGFAAMPENPYEICTVFRLKVLEVFRGGKEIGSIAEVMQPGGRMGNIIVSSHDIVRLVIGEDLVIFMIDNNFGRPMVLLNPSQSVYRVPLNMRVDDAALDIRENKIIHAYGIGELSADLILESYSDSNDLTLTVGDLMRIVNASVAETQSEVSRNEVSAVEHEYIDEYEAAAVDTRNEVEATDTEQDYEEVSDETFG